MPNVLIPRDIVSRPDNMDETVLHTHMICAVYSFMLMQTTTEARGIKSFLLCLGLKFYSNRFCLIFNEKQIVRMASHYHLKLNSTLDILFVRINPTCHVFSSPKPKAHGELIVYRSIRHPSVCASVRKHFQT